MLLRAKDFDSRYQDQQLDDWLYEDWNDLTTALKQAVTDLFTTGSDPSGDLETQVIPQLANALRAYVSAGVALDASSYLADQDSSPMMGMMSMSGAGSESKAGYLNAQNHVAISTALENVMKHAKAAKSALASVSSARRFNDLAGTPIYASSSDYFERKEKEKEDEEDLQLMVRTLTTELTLANEMRENREHLESTMDPLDVSAARLRRE